MPDECFEECVGLILREEPYLRGYARRLTRCDSDSDDLVQETLCRAYHARDRVQPGSSVRAWTRTILRRLYLTGAIRIRTRRLQTETDAGLPLDSACARTPSRDGASRPDLETIAESLDDTLKHALEHVREVYRTPFLLSVFGDLSYQEIGQRLLVPVGTVMSRIHRARRHLRDELAGHRPGVRNRLSTRDR